MRSQNPAEAACEPQTAATAVAGSGSARPAPEPRVDGTGYGPIGIAAVAAAVLYQGTAVDAPRAAAYPASGPHAPLSPPRRAGAIAEMHERLAAVYG
jgi:hypothetical protein